MSSTLITAYLGQGLAAARPATPAVAAGTYGTYFATDTRVWSAYFNSAWQTIGAGIDLFAPPLASTFPTIINAGGGSPAPAVSDTLSGMLFDSGPTIAADSVRAALQPIPHATTFTIVMGVRLNLVPLNYRSLGLGLYDGTKFVSFYQIGTAGTLQVNNFTNLTTFSSAPLNLAWGQQQTYYFKIQGDGVNLKYSISTDGRNFIQLLSTAIGAFLGTITKCGPISNANANTTPPAAGDHIFGDVFYWSATTP